MKDKLKKAVAWLKERPVKATLGVLLFIALLGAICSCEDKKSGDGPASIADVSGMYVVESGFQTITDSQGRDETVEFSLSDGITLQVVQSGNSITLFACNGVLNKDLKVPCVYKEELNFFGSKGCEEITGEIVFNDDEAELKVFINTRYDDMGYEGTNEVEVKLLFDKATCEGMDNES
jgi:hypothetical protein